MPSPALTERVCGVIATIFNLSPDQINADTSMSTLENWDSMGHLMLILELEQTFETGFEPEEVEKMTSVSAIVAALESKGVSE